MRNLSATYNQSAKPNRSMAASIPYRAGTGTLDVGDSDVTGPNLTQNLINLTAAQNRALQQQNQGLQGYGDNDLAILRALQDLRNQPPAPITELPGLDVADVFNQARKAATSNVSPYYEKQLQLFQQEQAKRKGRVEADTQTVISQASEDAKLALEELNQDVETARTRTAEDTTKSLNQTNASQEEFQDVSADAFTRSRNALREGLAGSNLTFSGLGQQRDTEALAQKAKGEARQVGKFDVQRQAATDFKTRTFEDLAKQQQRGTAATEKAKGRTIKVAQLNLERTLEDLIDEEVVARRQNEFQKNQAIDQQTGTEARSLFERFLGGLRNPDQVVLARNVYGGAFS